MRRLDFGGLLRIALTELRLTPDVFWRLTPAEFMQMTGRDLNQRPMGRRRLEELAAAFPDQDKG
jgi:uncharacterized phage protein (TIGR02216 family)